MGQPGQHAGGPAGDQFYVTHCTIADSVLDNPGYTVRASSSADRALLDAAFQYPPYELPIDMWRDAPVAAAAPRRLACTDHSGGRAWAVHSAYLEKDTVGRDRSYFSHLLLLPQVDPADVLRSWGADGWVKSYPSGAPKSLPGKARLPVGQLVSDAALTAFLGDSPQGPTDLGVTVCPKRLRTTAAARREVLARFLHAMVLLATEEDEDRQRLYVHAEPGLVALLLYGAVRLLPSAATDRLTFSTFEPYHRNVRDYRLAEVVGTYLGVPDKGLDPDLATTRGITLDTFSPARSSPELGGTHPPPVGLGDLIDLVAAGEWNLLPVVKDAVGPEVEGLPEAGRAVGRARGLAKVDSGQASVEELIAIQADPRGAAELKARAGRIWPQVREAALARADARAAFHDLLAEPERVREVWEEAVRAILAEDFRKWDSRWAVVRSAAGPKEAQRLLAKLVGSEKNEDRVARLPTDVRQRMRAACADVGMLPPRALLVPIGLGELEPLLGARDPAAAGYTAFVLLADDSLGWLAHVPPANREQMRRRAREFLFNAPAAGLAAYVRAARAHLDTDPALVATLFVPHSERGARLMDRLLASGALEPADWVKLYAAVGLTQDEWGEYLLEQDRLASFLVGLGGAGLGRDVWQGYLDSLTPALVSPELIEVEGDVEPQAIHDWERKVHGQLRAAAERLTAAGAKLAPALPEGGVARLFAANNLVKWADSPASAATEGSDEVQHACAALAVDPLDLVRVAYLKGGYDAIDPATGLQNLAPLVALFKACFPVDANFHTAGRAAREAVRLSRYGPGHYRGALQALLLHSCVPEMHYQALLNADWKEPLHPLAQARLGEWAARAAKKGATKYVPPAKPSTPAAAPAAEAAFEDEPGEEAPVIEKRKGRQSYKKAKKSGCGLFLAAVAVAAACALAALAG